jgi:hypothetical protein
MVFRADLLRDCVLARLKGEHGDARETQSRAPAKLRLWHEHVYACQASGQTMVTYARVHRLSVKEFYRAKARLVRYGGDELLRPRSVFQRVEVVSAPLRLASCRVYLPNGVGVEFGVEDAALGRVLQAAGALY